MQLRAALDEAIREFGLLKHPFYQAWTAGTLPRETLAHYARQYHHHVLAFPTYVSAVHARCGDDLEARRSLLENLIEEERGETNHAGLWAQFAEGIGVGRGTLREPPVPAVVELVSTFRKLTTQSAPIGAAALYAYESQVPGVAEAKIDGLRKNFGVTEAATLEFFEVHRTLDRFHSDATAAIVERQATDAAAAIDGARQAARALWNFLDAMPRERLAA